MIIAGINGEEPPQPVGKRFNIRIAYEYINAPADLYEVEVIESDGDSITVIPLRRVA